MIRRNIKVFVKLLAGRVSLALAMAGVCVSTVQAQVFSTEAKPYYQHLRDASNSYLQDNAGADNTVAGRVAKVAASAKQQWALIGTPERFYMKSKAGHYLSWWDNKENKPILNFDAVEGNVATTSNGDDRLWLKLEYRNVNDVRIVPIGETKNRSIKPNGSANYGYNDADNFFIFQESDYTANDDIATTAQKQEFPYTLRFVSNNNDQVSYLTPAGMISGNATTVLNDNNVPLRTWDFEYQNGSKVKFKLKNGATQDYFRVVIQGKTYDTFELYQTPEGKTCLHVADAYNKATTGKYDAQWGGTRKYEVAKGTTDTDYRIVTSVNTDSYMEVIYRKVNANDANNFAEVEGKYFRIEFTNGANQTGNNNSTSFLYDDPTAGIRKSANTAVSHSILWKVEKRDNDYVLRSGMGNYLAFEDDKAKKVTTAAEATRIYRLAVQQNANTNHWRLGFTNANNKFMNGAGETPTLTDGVNDTYIALVLDPYQVADLQIHPRASYIKDLPGANAFVTADGFQQNKGNWTIDKPDAPDGKIQNVNTFRQTVYVKEGDEAFVYMPTYLQNQGQPHRAYQRIYLYDEETGKQTAPSNDRVVLSALYGYSYQNGFVTGTMLPRHTIFDEKGNVIGWAQAGANGRNTDGLSQIYRRMTVKNPNNQAYTVAIDMSRMSDYKVGPTGHDDNLYYEPSLTMRAIYDVRPASEIAAKLKEVTEQGDFLEKRTIHFPAKSPNNLFEHIPLNMEIQNYWFGEGNNLTNAGASKDNIIVELNANGTGIQLAKAGAESFNTTDYGGRKIRCTLVDGLRTFYENNNNADFKRSSFVEFSYPGATIPSHTGANAAYAITEHSGWCTVNRSGEAYPATITVKGVKDGKTYNIAKFTIIFDDNSETVPIYDVMNTPDIRDNRTHEAVSKKQDVVARVDFDYPEDAPKFRFPDVTNPDYVLPQEWHHNNKIFTNRQMVTHDCMMPLNFDDSQYSFSNITFDVKATTNYNDPLQPAGQQTWSAGDMTFMEYGSNDDGKCMPREGMKFLSWGMFGLGEYIYKGGADKIQLFNIQQAVGGDENNVYTAPLRDGFTPGILYVDASESPGVVTKVNVNGNFCAGTSLTISGWFGCMNRFTHEQELPGSVMLEIVGVSYDGTEKVVYTFCPGQINRETLRYNKDDNPEDSWYWNGENDDDPKAAPGAWTQFFTKFELKSEDISPRYVLRIVNNSPSSAGGDYVLDDIYVYAVSPALKSEEYTPFCDGDIALHKLSFKTEAGELVAKDNFNTAGKQTYFNLIYCETEEYVRAFWQWLYDHRNDTDVKNKPNVTAYNEWSKLVEQTRDPSYEQGYELTTQFILTKAFSGPETFKNAFLAAMKAGICKKSDGKNAVKVVDLKGSTGLVKDYDVYNYKTSNVIGQPDAAYKNDADGGEVVINARIENGDAVFESGKQYFMIGKITLDRFDTADYSDEDLYAKFGLHEGCGTFFGNFKVKPGIDIYEDDQPMIDPEAGIQIACNGTNPTFGPSLYAVTPSADGKTLKKVKIENATFDWWMGQKVSATDYSQNTLGRLSTYNDDSDDSKHYYKLHEALNALRAHYPLVTEIDNSVRPKNAEGGKPELTEAQIALLKAATTPTNGWTELYLGQATVTLPMDEVMTDNGYAYYVVIPTSSYFSDINLYEDEVKAKVGSNPYWFCDKAQEVKVKLDKSAPKLSLGLDNKHNGENLGGPLSIRITKSQFEQVRDGYENAGCLYIPLYGAEPSEGVTELEEFHTQNINGEDERSVVHLVRTDDANMGKKYVFDARNDDLSFTRNAVGEMKLLTAKQGDSEDANWEQSKNYIKVQFDTKFEVRDGYEYVLKMPFQDKIDRKDQNYVVCPGDVLVYLKIVPDYEVWTGAAGNQEWNSDENWRRAEGYVNANNNEMYLDATAQTAPNYGYKYITNTTNKRQKGFAPIYRTRVLIMADRLAGKDTKKGVNGPSLYDTHEPVKMNDKHTFPVLRVDQASPMLKYDLQAHDVKDLRTEHPNTDATAEAYKEYAWLDYTKTNEYYDNDLFTEIYQSNTCKEINFQPGTELLNAFRLNYRRAWTEYELNNDRWYLLSSPLKSMVSGDWYAPHSGESNADFARQQTIYFNDIEFDDALLSVKNDRFSPAVYQRSWDKATAVVYEIGSEHESGDKTAPGNANNDATPTTPGASASDDYLNRLGYKPIGDKKANVAYAGRWSSVYNDASEVYVNGGFSVRPKSDLKEGKTQRNLLFRFPKADDWYRYHDYANQVAGTNTNNTNKTFDALAGNIAQRDQLKTTGLVDETAAYDGTAYTFKYGVYNDEEARIDSLPGEISQRPVTAFTDTVKADGNSKLNLFVVGNPFMTGLDMDKFFADNPNLEQKFWLLSDNNQAVSVKDESDTTGRWTSNSDEDNHILAPYQGFFVKLKGDTPVTEAVINFNEDMQAQAFIYQEVETTQEVYVMQKVEAVPLPFGFTDNGDGTYNYPQQNPATPNDVDNILLYKWMVDGQTEPNAQYAYVPDDPVAGTYKVYNRPVYQAYCGDPEQMYVYESYRLKDGVEATADMPATISYDDFKTKDQTFRENYVPASDAGILYDEVICYDLQKAYQYVKSNSESTSLKARRRTRGSSDSDSDLLTITAQRGNNSHSAVVRVSENADDAYVATEDVEAFMDSNLEESPLVYTLADHMATTINQMSQFKVIPVGIESKSEEPATVTFKNVSVLGGEAKLYDALTGELTDLEDGTSVEMPGKNHNRYYIVNNAQLEEAIKESNLRVWAENRTAHVVSSTNAPITNVRISDVAGRLVTTATPGTAEFTAKLPGAGIYVIEAATEKDSKTLKVQVK